MGVSPRLHSEREQPHVDPQERLRDFILEFTADRFSFVFLSGQQPVRQLAQSFLQTKRFFQTFVVQLPTLLVRVLHGLSLDDSPLQLPVGGGEFRGTMAEPFRELIHVNGGLRRNALGLLDPRVYFPKK